MGQMKKDSKLKIKDGSKPRIFYGDASKRLWNKINNISDDALGDTIYLLGCKLQELEHRLEEVERS